MYFELNSDGELVINNIMIQAVPEFQKLMRRLRGMEGDHDGRRKMLNKKEMLYVYYMCEWTDANILAALPDDERDVEARKLTGVPANWMPDEVVQKAISRYMWMQTILSPHGRVLIAAKKNLMQMATSFDIISTQNSQLIRMLEVQMTNSFEKGSSAKEVETDALALQALTTTLQNNLQNAMLNIKSVAAAFKQLEELEKTVKEERTENEEIYGSRILGARENPVGNF